MNAGRCFAGIIGAVIGDAVGVPYEFKSKESFHCVSMRGHGTYNQPAGTWSDDSSMMLATIRSLVDNGGKISLSNIMDNFAKWYYHGEFTPYGKTFDCGRTTSAAIEKYTRLISNGVAPETAVFCCGGDEFEDCGNGSLMRILPLAFINATSEDVANVSALTHAYPTAMDYCNRYVNLARRLYANPTGGICTLVREDEVKNDGYVADTYDAAVWCVATSESYKETILKAVNLGGDTDTIASVAGGLAGLIYSVGGRKGIPIPWVKKVAKSKEITLLLQKFIQVIV